MGMMFDWHEYEIEVVNYIFDNGNANRDEWANLWLANLMRLFPDAYWPDLIARPRITDPTDPAYLETDDLIEGAMFTPQRLTKEWPSWMMNLDLFHEME